MVKGLNCMHPKGLYHRDLKPLNIVVSGWSGGKLVDWASGRSMHQRGRVNEMYSPAYASPEIIAQMHGFCKVMTDQPNDLWALGITLHQVFKPQLADCFWVCSCRGSHVY